MFDKGFPFILDSFVVFGISSSHFSGAISSKIIKACVLEKGEIRDIMERVKVPFQGFPWLI